MEHERRIVEGEPGMLGMPPLGALALWRRWRRRRAQGREPVTDGPRPEQVEPKPEP